MNTGQLVALWYGGLVIVGILFNQSTRWSVSPNYGIAAVAVLTGLAIYTMRPHPAARKGLVFIWVLSVPLAIALALFVAWLVNK